MNGIYKIDLKDAGILNATAKNYLSGDLSEFVSFFCDENGIKNAIESRNNFKINRSVLADVLAVQNANAGKKVLQNIESLRSENTFTVTTGHQLCLFTGPLYFIYKILHAIKSADELKKKYPDKNFVPVYWMASEDHDFEEISEANIFGKKLKWAGELIGGAVGRVRSRPDRTTASQIDNRASQIDNRMAPIDSVLSQLKSILGNSSIAQDIYSIIEKCYSQNNLSDAIRMLVDYLFADYGLVVIDGDNKKLKELFVPILLKEIEEEFVFKTVSSTNILLEKKGLKPQVNPREINLFYLAENSRERIVYEKDKYFTADFSKEWTKAQILNEIKTHPENFSPNVLMRALYQESILPNIVYVGGGGEISYWLQMKKMFEVANMFFPSLVVRHSFLIVENVQLEKIKKLGFEVQDFLKSEEELIKEFLNNNMTVEIELTEEKEKLTKVFTDLTEKLAQTDATLRSSGEAEMQKALKSIEMLEAKIRRAEKSKHETSLNQIKQLKNKFFPNGIFQETHDNFLSFWEKSDGKLVGELLGIMGKGESELKVLG